MRTGGRPSAFWKGRAPPSCCTAIRWGRGVAVQLATECRIAALILEAPFTSITEVASRRFPFIPVKWLIRNRFESLGKIGRVRAPVLIYCGTRDAVIPGDQFVRLFDAAAEPKQLKVIDGADHLDAWELGGAEACVKFLQTLRCAG